MRQLISVLVLSSFWALSITSSQAQIASKAFSAADLKSECKDATSAVCTAYIAGYAQGYYYSSVSTQAGYAPCATGSLNVTNARYVTTKFLDDHPEVMAQGAASVVAEALASAYPCTNSR